MALDSLALYTDGLEVGVGGEIGGFGCRWPPQLAFAAMLCSSDFIISVKDSGS